jgi:hypothetical protein
VTALKTVDEVNEGPCEPPRTMRVWFNVPGGGEAELRMAFSGDDLARRHRRLWLLAGVNLVFGLTVSAVTFWNVWSNNLPWGGIPGILLLCLYAPVEWWAVRRERRLLWALWHDRQARLALGVLAGHSKGGSA